MVDFPKVRFLGIDLAAAAVGDAAKEACIGGLFLAPSGPGLCDLEFDADYREALLAADVNLADSGLAILLARVLGLGKLPRTSGLGFLEALLVRTDVKAEGATFWVMPSRESMERNLDWLRSKGLRVSKEDCHIAPVYPRRGPVADEVFLERLRRREVRFVFICTGSGSQEKLGHWLRQRIDSGVAICCIGAAIGFLSGDQVRIPRWADRACLGWLIRCASDPGRFLPRYFKALRLVWLVIKYRDQAPPLRSRG